MQPPRQSVKNNDYINDLDSVTVIQLDCDHYIFHYEPERIAEEIKSIFINTD